MNSSFIAYLSDETIQIYNYLEKEDDTDINRDYIHPSSWGYLFYQQSPWFKILKLNLKNHIVSFTYDKSSKINFYDVTLCDNNNYFRLSYNFETSKMNISKKDFLTDETTINTFENVQLDLKKYFPFR